MRNIIQDRRGKKLLGRHARFINKLVDFQFENLELRNQRELMAEFAWASVSLTLIIGALLLVFCAGTAHAQVIDIKKIILIESSGNPWAHQKADDSRGLMQITPIVLKEWNNYHATERYTLQDLWNQVVNVKIGKWYLEKRIPQMLRAYKKPVTEKNILISYNAGIFYVVKNRPIPNITRKYLKKYGIES